jgi:hypothetical protein
MMFQLPVSKTLRVLAVTITHSIQLCYNMTRGLRDMRTIPHKLPGLKWATALLAVYAVIWMPIEGNLPLTVLLGAWVTAVAAAYTVQGQLGGQTLSWREWVGLTAVTGLLIGLSAGFIVLAFMALKTGLHDHGPEFSRAEINWVIQRIPTWTTAGLLAGLGLGLLTMKREE